MFGDFPPAVRVCSMCGVTKKRDEFYPSRRSKSGVQTYCKACSSTISRARYLKSELVRERLRVSNGRIVRRNKEIVDRFLATRSCSVCGETARAKLTFHHRDPGEKLFTIGSRAQKKPGVKALKEEIAKCDVLCHNCHQQLEHDKRNQARAS